ncbi:hypothetical protein JKP88DRAFT_263159 [Tribonema minus]|uniref:Uncharacterized protein n=1 Tax=Tribonema minus TaxID=303371 RepID=A0A835YYU9_9STRA|nr:hypothetical protein JKP88DRAFT_263159 [Tribonema minus]
MDGNKESGTVQAPVAAQAPASSGIARDGGVPLDTGGLFMKKRKEPGASSAGDYQCPLYRKRAASLPPRPPPCRSPNAIRSLSSPSYRIRSQLCACTPPPLLHASGPSGGVGVFQCSLNSACVRPGAFGVVKSIPEAQAAHRHAGCNGTVSVCTASERALQLNSVSTVHAILHSLTHVALPPPPPGTLHAAAAAAKLSHLTHGQKLSSVALAAAAAADLARDHATPGVAFEAREFTVRCVIDADVTLAAADLDRLHRALTACGGSSAATAAAGTIGGEFFFFSEKLKLNMPAVRAVIDVDVTLAAADLDRLHRALTACGGSAAATAAAGTIGGAASWSGEGGKRRRETWSKTRGWPHGARVRVDPDLALMRKYVESDLVLHPDMQLTLTSRCSPPSARCQLHVPVLAAACARCRALPPAPAHCHLRPPLLSQPLSHASANCDCPTIRLTTICIRRCSLPYAAARCHVRPLLLARRARLLAQLTATCLHAPLFTAAADRFSRYLPCAPAAARCHLHIPANGFTYLKHYAQLLAATHYPLLLAATLIPREVQLTPDGAPAGAPPEVWQEFALSIPNETDAVLSSHYAKYAKWLRIKLGKGQEERMIKL